MHIGKDLVRRKYFKKSVTMYKDVAKASGMGRSLKMSIENRKKKKKVFVERQFANSFLGRERHALFHSYVPLIIFFLKTSAISRGRVLLRGSGLSACT